MYKKEIELTIIDQINTYNGSKMTSNRSGVDSLAAYRLGKNAEILEKRVIEFEQQRMIILKEFVVLTSDGELTRGEDGLFKFKNEVSKADADLAIKALIETLGVEKYNLWIFEASEIDKKGEANIIGDLWKLIDKIVVDNNPT